MHRTWCERRHHRNRVIRKRVGIARNVWSIDGAFEQAGKIVGYHYNALGKDNLSCGCPMCKMSRQTRPKHKYDEVTL